MHQITLSKAENFAAIRRRRNSGAPASTPAEQYLLERGDQIGGALERTGEDDADEPGVSQLRLQRRAFDAAVGILFLELGRPVHRRTRRQQAGANR